MRTSEIIDLGSPAYDVRVPNESLRASMQTQVLAAQSDRFQQAVEAFRQYFKERPRASSGPLGQIVELDDNESEPSACLTNVLQIPLTQTQWPAKELSLLAWKIERLPDRASTILSIGSGGGDELMFLRARFPDARITAVDYTMRIRGGQQALDLLNVEFIEGDIFATVNNLRSHGASYDLIFSNHVIEHFYEPDEQIASLSLLLVARGVFAAGLPLDAYPLADLLARTSKAPQSIHPLDMNWLDVRHPWKTNESDLAATLRSAGLDDVIIYRRANHASRTIPISLHECQRRERRARVLYALSLQPVISALKVIFGPTPPRRLVRLLFAVDRRLWFGRYRLKVDVQPEVFVTASRQ
jgi:SAM-dependent methyltransferase